jgi:hypothetical protein
MKGALAVPDERPSFEELLRAVRAFLTGPKVHPVHLDVKLSDGSHFQCPVGLFGVPQECMHNDTFSECRWRGTPYEFPDVAQAQVVRLLWRAWEEGKPGLRGPVIFDSPEGIVADTDASWVSDLFKNHPAWGAMIDEQGGLFTLTGPPPRRD